MRNFVQLGDEIFQTFGCKCERIAPAEEHVPNPLCFAHISDGRIHLTI